MKFPTTLALGVALATQAVTVIAEPSHDRTLAFSPKDQNTVINRWNKGEIAGYLAGFSNELLAIHENILNNTLPLKNQTEALLEAIHEGHVGFIAPVFKHEEEILDKGIETVKAGGQTPAEIMRIIRDVTKKVNDVKERYSAFRHLGTLHPRQQWLEDIAMNPYTFDLAEAMEPIVASPILPGAIGTVIAIGMAGGITAGVLVAKSAAG